MISNNVTRLLDSKKIIYNAFEIPAEKLSAEETAIFLGVPVEVVFKTIVVVRQKDKPLLCPIPGDRRVDLKAVAAFIGEKKVGIPTQDEAEKLTGLQAGGISPLALINKGFQTIIDSNSADFEKLFISGGQRGLIIQIKPEALIKLTNAKIAKISQIKE